MVFFWPRRMNVPEPTETVEDPYDDKCERAPKRLRKESSSSSNDDSDVEHISRKQFGQFPDSDESSSSSSEEEKPKFEEIPADPPNDEDDEFEVWLMRNTYQIQQISLIFGHFFLTDFRENRNANNLSTNNILLLPLVWRTLHRCR